MTSIYRSRCRMWTAKESGEAMQWRCIQDVEDRVVDHYLHLAYAGVDINAGHYVGTNTIERVRATALFEKCKSIPKLGDFYASIGQSEIEVGSDGMVRKIPPALSYWARTMERFH